MDDSHHTTEIQHTLHIGRELKIVYNLLSYKHLGHCPSSLTYLYF